MRGAEPDQEPEEETAAIADGPAPATPRHGVAAPQPVKPEPAPQPNGLLSNSAAQPKDDRAAEIDAVRHTLVCFGACNQVGLPAGMGWVCTHATSRTVMSSQRTQVRQNRVNLVWEASLCCSKGSCNHMRWPWSPASPEFVRCRHGRRHESRQRRLRRRRPHTSSPSCGASSHRRRARWRPPRRCDNSPGDPGSLTAQCTWCQANVQRYRLHCKDID